MDVDTFDRQVVSVHATRARVTELDGILRNMTAERDEHLRAAALMEQELKEAKTKLSLYVSHPSSWAARRPAAGTAWRRSGCGRALAVGARGRTAARLADRRISQLAALEGARRRLAVARERHRGARD